jgi:hypothetical protein
LPPFLGKKQFCFRLLRVSWDNRNRPCRVMSV